MSQDCRKIVARVDQLKRQLIVHSVIYYKLGDNIISDEDWDRRALELRELIREGHNTPLHQDLFEDFKGETGYHLCLKEYIPKATQLLRYNDSLSVEDK